MFEMLLHLPADAVQLHSLPKGALCSFDVSQLLPQKGAAAHPKRERSIPKCIVAQLSSAKRNSSTARGSICAKFFSVCVLDTSIRIYISICNHSLNWENVRLTSTWFCY